MLRQLKLDCVGVHSPSDYPEDNPEQDYKEYCDRQYQENQSYMRSAADLFTVVLFISLYINILWGVIISNGGKTIRLVYDNFGEDT